MTVPPAATTDPISDKPLRPRRCIPLSLRIFAIILGVFGTASVLWFMSVWLSWHREQQVIQTIEGRGGRVTRDTAVPWLRRIVSDDRMRHFKLFDRVVCVNLEGTIVTDAEIAHLTRLKNLEYVNLFGTAATDSGLAHLSGLANLESLYLGNTTITDAGLAHLSRSTKLKVLWLEGTAVTDKGLAHLSRLENLKELFFKNTPVTDSNT